MSTVHSIAEAPIGVASTNGQPRVLNRLTDADRRALQVAHLTREIASLELQRASLQWDSECERIGAVYRINPNEQMLNITTGEITVKEKVDEPCSSPTQA